MNSLRPQEGGGKCGVFQAKAEAKPVTGNSIKESENHEIKN